MRADWCFDVLKEIAVGLLLVLSFSQGIWQAAGIAEGIPKALIELLSVVLLVAAVWQCKKANQRFRGLVFLVLLAAAWASGAVSGWLQDSSALEQLFYLRAVLAPPIVFFALLNLPIKAAGVRRLSMLVIILISIQAPIFAWKWYAVGVNEKFWIGSLSQTAGQLGLIFPMLVLAVVLPWYLHNGRRALALLILIFAFLPVINEKRGVMVAIPAILFLAVGAYFATKRGRNLIALNINRWLLSRLSVVVLVCLTVWVGAAKLIPSLYCERFQSCHQQTTTYFFDYLTRNYASPMNASRLSVEKNTNIQLGRLELVRASLALMAERGTLVTLFGFGAGAVNPSPHLGTNRSDIMYDKFGLRGTYSSALALLYEAGITGVLSMLGFFGLLSAAVMKRIKAARNDDRCLTGLGILLMISVMAFDYFLYSTTGWSSSAIAPLFFTSVGIFLVRSQQECEAAFALGPK